MSDSKELVLALGARLGLSEGASREFVALLTEIQKSDATVGNVSSAEPVHTRTHTTDGATDVGPVLADVRNSSPFLDRHRDPRRLGSGGMGEVFLVHEAILNRDVALKAVLPKLASKPASVKRFVREAQITAQLQHPGVVP